jgi:hypothetical protein
MFLKRKNNHFSEEHYMVSFCNRDAVCNKMLKLSKQYSILIYIQQDATLHSLFYLETALYVSGGTTTHHQGCKQPYLQHLVFVTPLQLSATIVECAVGGVHHPKHLVFVTPLLLPAAIVEELELV